ncbi:hypothetical protein VTL71DRAFT_13497, partial [Oculimacula yallundae]
MSVTSSLLFREINSHSPPSYSRQSRDPRRKYPKLLTIYFATPLSAGGHDAVRSRIADEERNVSIHKDKKGSSTASGLLVLPRSVQCTTLSQCYPVDTPSLSCFYSSKDLPLTVALSRKPETI